MTPEELVIEKKRLKGLIDNAIGAVNKLDERFNEIGMERNSFEAGAINIILRQMWKSI